MQQEQVSHQFDYIYKSEDHFKQKSAIMAALKKSIDIIYALTRIIKSHFSSRLYIALKVRFLKISLEFQIISNSFECLKVVCFVNNKYHS
jgi:hypothetical protein